MNEAGRTIRMKRGRVWRKRGRAALGDRIKKRPECLSKRGPRRLLPDKEKETRCGSNFKPCIFEAFLRVSSYSALRYYSTLKFSEFSSGIYSCDPLVTVI